MKKRDQLRNALFFNAILAKPQSPNPVVPNLFPLLDYQVYFALPRVPLKYPLWIGQVPLVGKHCIHLNSTPCI
jgi:hypothetical protein